MKPRKLKLLDGTWRFLVRYNETVLWSPGGKKTVHMNWCISGAPPTAHLCGDSRCCDPGFPVTPGKLRTFIENEMIDEAIQNDHPGNQAGRGLICG